MGVSTDAIYCYGFEILDEDGHELCEGEMPEWLRADDGEERTFENFVAVKYGLTEPYDEYDGDRFRSDPQYEEVWSNHWDAKRKLVEEVGVSLVRHCSHEFPMYILAAKASVVEANRGSVKTLSVSDVDYSFWRQTIREFCEKAQVSFHEPRRLLCSYWG